MAEQKRAEAELPAEPFAFGDYTWLNGANRQKKALLDSKYFTASFLIDVNYTLSAANPIDNTVVGSTALSRNNEITFAFLGFGGDFHWDNARGRLMTQFGIRSDLVPRNDVSTMKGSVRPPHSAPLRQRGVRRLPLRRAGMDQYRRRYLHVLCWPLLLRQLRELDVPAVVHLG